MGCFLLLCMVTFLVVTAAEEPVFLDYNAREEVQFLLYTRQNPSAAEPVPIDVDGFQFMRFYHNSSHPTKFIIHGWRSDGHGDVARVKDEYLRHRDMNVYCVDWSRGSNDDLLVVMQRVQEVGTVVAEFIANLQDMAAVNVSEVVLVGHGLGGHISGIAGRVLHANYDDRQLGAIVALDPTLSFSSQGYGYNGLLRSDARYVQMIKTSALGLHVEVGHGNFFPNYGFLQPSCRLDEACSHSIALRYFAETINKDVVGTECSLLQMFLRVCLGRSTGRMGGGVLDEGAQGTFYTRVTDNERGPYFHS